MSQIIGLTGGIASGKSTVAKILKELGATIVDADLVAREVVAPGTKGLAEIVAAFGDVLLPDGTLDRKKVGTIIFGDPNARKILSQITHPKIAMASQQAFLNYRDAGIDPIIYEAALIVENGFYKILQGLIVVSVPPPIQLERLIQRDNISEVDAQARIDSQFPLSEKLKVANYVIDNSQSLEHTREQSVKIWQQLQPKEST